MISPKLAFKNITRRPVQNLAVIVGITLGVSLFVGIQVGTDSLGATFETLALENLGEKDATFSSGLSDFFVDGARLNESLNESLYLPVSNYPAHLNDQLLNNQSIQAYVEKVFERTIIDITAIHDETGSIEVSRNLVGISENETGFGNFIDQSGDILQISELNDGEVYIGRDLAQDLFGDADPVGENLTISSTLFTNSIISLTGIFPETNESLPFATFNTTIHIRGVFEEEERGREFGNNFFATSISWLQESIFNTYNDSNSLIFIPPATFLPSIVGYGRFPVNNLVIKWKDSVDTYEEREIAFNATRDAMKSILGDFGEFASYSNSVNNIQDQIEFTLGFMETILNVFGSLIAMAAVLVIINIQSMALQAREKETGIIRGIGAKRGQIINSNLAESLFLGLIGSGLGLGGGYLYGRALILFLSIAFGFDQAFITITLTQRIIGTSIFWGVVISQVTGLIPAINASRVNVAQVLRGIPPLSSPKGSRKFLIGSTVLLIVGIYLMVNLDPNPFVEGKDAFKILEDAEAIYLPIALIILSPALFLANFLSKKAALTFGSISLQAWAYVNIFVIFPIVETAETANGGLFYIGYIMFSLVGGSILLVGINLDTIAEFGENFMNIFARGKDSPLRGTSMVAFRQMRSKKVRSTLTFALFATILTLNIFIGSWSYSTRFGLDDVIQELSGNVDIIVASSQPIPESIDFDQKLVDEFGSSRNVTIEYARSFTLGRSANLYIENDDGELQPLGMVPITADPDVFWSDSTHDEWLIKFDLADNKTGTPFETREDVPEELSANEEDEAVWDAVLNNETVNGIPLIVTSTLFDFLGGFQILGAQGDTVWLNTTDGGLQEFLIASIVENTPIDGFIGGPGNGPPAAQLYVSEFWASKLTAFSGKVGSEEIFVAKTNLERIDDPEMESILIDIEKWANSKDGGFRKEVGVIYGIYTTTVYSIYEGFLEGQFRFFNFLQAFVSLGFAAGILGLLVVASRSVAERKRQIGMLRALGFRRQDIVTSVILELVVMGLIGLVLGIINGTVMGYALTKVNNQDAIFLIPWGLLLGYGAVTFLAAIIAAIFPGITASRIPPSEALRYTG